MRRIPTMLCLAAAALCCGCDSDAEKQPVAPKSWTITAEAVGAAAGGQVSRCDAQGAGCKPLAKGDTLTGDAVVKTGSGANALLRLDPSTTVALDENASVALAQVVGPAVSTRTVTLRGGRIVMHREQADKSEPIAVRLADTSASLQPDSTLAARSRAADRAVLTVHRGKLALTTAAGGAVRLRAGESAHIVKGKAPDKRAVWAGELPQIEAELPSFAGREKVTTITSTEPRGVGTMTARIPGRSEVVSGVRLLSHHVRVAVRDGFARTEIEEEFQNDTNRVLEGRYVFPLPPDASISRVALWVGKDLVEGELVEKKRAARIFKGIVDDTVRPRDPALLEWVRGGQFSLKIFPIPAKKSRKVIVAYNQALEHVGAGYRYIYPMALGKQRATKIDDFSITIKASDTRSPIKAARVLGHDVAADPIKDGVANIHYETKAFVPDRDFAVSLERAPSEGAELSAYVADWGEFAPPGLEKSKNSAAAPDSGGYFALRVRADLPAGAPLPKLGRLDRAIVIDKSYSQSAETLAGEVELALGLVRSMDPDERFVLLACDSSCSSYPPSGLASATKDSLSKASAWLDKLAAAGASDVAGALLAATKRLESKKGDGQLIYIGDGSASAGPLHAATIAARVAKPVEERKLDVRLLSAGRSIDLLVVGELAQRLGGSHQQVSRAGEPLHRRVRQLALELRQPVVRKVKLSLPAGFEKIYPSQLPNLRLGQEVVVVGKLTARQTGEVVLSGELGSGDYRLSRAVHWTEEANRNNPLVPRLWASARIDALQASSDKAAQKQVIALSKQYRVMSRHTSYLVLENDAMFAQFGIRRTVPGAARRSSGRPGGLSAEEAKAAEIARDLAELDVQSVGALGGAGTSRAGSATGSGKPLSGIGERGGSPATPASAAKKVKGPKGSARVGGAGVAGGKIGNASSVVARMRGRFRACYQAGLNKNPEISGSATLVAKIGPNGSVTSVGGGGGGSIGAIVPCLKSVVRSGAFSPPEGGSAVISIPITFVKQGGGGSSSSPPISSRPPSRTPPWARPRSRSSRRVPMATLLPGNDDWMSTKGNSKQLTKLTEKLEAEPTSRKRHEALIRKLIVLGRFDLALTAAKRFAKVDPDLDRARELLSYAAAVNGDGALALDAMASQVETNPRDLRAQLRAARAYDGAGDSARACAHWTAIAELQPKSVLASHAAKRCSSQDEAKEAPKQGYGQLEAKLDCSGADCPTPVVIAPNGTVYSPWTPSTARVTGNSIAVQRLPAGTYRILLFGGAANKTVKLTLRAANKTRTFQVDRSKAKTAVVAHVRYGSPIGN